MGIMSGLFSGISGLNANGSAMSVIGDNIANIASPAFKTSRVSFANVLSQSLSGGSSSSQVGNGVALSTISSLWGQGSFETTGNPTDLAINGKGFFVVADQSGRYYTRAGQFDFTHDGNMVNPEGLVVQGWMANSSGVIPTTASSQDISISSVSSAPRATPSFNLGVNLDADADGSVPDTYSTSFTIYDSLGSTHTATLNFTKTAVAGEWQWYAAFSDGAATVVPDVTTPRYIQFDTSGTLIGEGAASPAAGTVDPTITITNLSNGAADFAAANAITWDLFLPDTTSNGSMTGYALASSTNSLTQSGYGAGTLQGISINEEGMLSGYFSNGQTRDIAQMALADFPSYAGLSKMGGNIYMETIGSGQPNIGTAGTGTRGKISSSALEMSNVDMAAEFVKMITVQRAFQANSRIITTTDDMLQELVNLKR